MTSASVYADDGLPLTAPLLLRARSQARAGHPFLICDDEVLAYSDACARSALLAKALLACGAGLGSHVGLLYPNGPDFVVGWLAAARIGAATIPISTFSTADELRVLLRKADVEILLAASTYRAHDYHEKLAAAVPELDYRVPPPLLAPSLPALRRVAFDRAPAGAAAGWTLGSLLQGGADVDDQELTAAEDSVRPSDRLVIVHTSGSTSEPKGVIHQHGPLIRHQDNLNQLRRYESHEVLFCNSPFFWIGGVGYSLLATLLAGGTLVCSNAPDPSGVLDLIERTRPTMVNGFAQSIANLPNDPSFAGRDLSSIRRGNLYPIMPDDVRPADPELRHNMLGATETGSVCLASEDESEQPESRRGSFGRPVPGFEARIINPETGVTCATGEVGELWLRGPFLMEGYYGRERHETFQPDGWYRTGDLFSVDAEGFFYFKGRASDMIKTSGANVSPREVEAAILEETGLVAHVVGLDDQERGQVVAAALRVPTGRDAPDADELQTRLRARLSAYKVPKLIVTMADAEVPMMSSGKLDLPALKERFRGS
ncbi:MAG TPA: class I adenylate-forming enzyme family protein [Acidimicrobiales bacterium]|nr:class I adenylate-forming enzyme family protein [Acidimicrobiales bacterium]